MSPEKASGAEQEPPQPEAPADVIVVGGGIGGLSAAFALARKGIYPGHINRKIN